MKLVQDTSGKEGQTRVCGSLWVFISQNLQLELTQFRSDNNAPDKSAGIS